MLKKALIQQFNFTLYTMEKNLEGMSHEDCLTRSEGGGNSANWVLGHIVLCRDLAHQLVGADTLMTEEEGFIYRRGAEPQTDPDNELPLEKLMKLCQISQKEIILRLEGMTDEQFGAPKPEGWKSPGGDTVGEQLAALTFHEAYHAGQLGMIRRAKGLENPMT